MNQPFVLCGLGRIGWRVLEYLQAGGFPVVVIDTNCAADEPRLGRARLVKGDCRRQDRLVEAGVERARGVLILTSDDLVNISSALLVRQLNPDVRVIIRMVNENLIARLGKAVVNVLALSTSTLAGPLLALTASTGRALGAFRVTAGEDGRRQVAEVHIHAHSSLEGQRIATVAAAHQAFVLAHLPAGASPRFLRDVDPEAALRPGDHLVVCGEPHHVAPLFAGSEEDVPTHVLWAGWLRRTGRMFWRTLGEVDLAVKICTGVLLLVITVSTLVMHFGVRDYHLGDALYRTVSIMATGAEMGEQDYKQDERLKVFVALLRIIGAALTAAFTAIVTNYLLRAHLYGALEARRIPDSGHIIVCGLGSVGFRVVEELVGSGERVVVIERAGDNPLVTTARHLGVPVILGDATVLEVLRQAHSSTARAVVAATTNDLINLEIALLVRELNPLQRVVPCLADAHLAQSLREAANVRLTVSVPALAAPAFLAALFGDRVQSVFMLQARLLAVVDLLVQPVDSFLAGQAVCAVAVDYRMVPVAVFDAAGKLQEQPLQARLEPGWRVLGIVALSDLERLFRRQLPARDCLVEVTRIPPSAQVWVGQLLSTHRGLDSQTAARELETLPALLAERLSRGEAEDLIALLRREAVEGQLRVARTAPVTARP